MEMVLIDEIFRDAITLRGKEDAAFNSRASPRSKKAFYLVAQIFIARNTLSESVSVAPKCIRLTD